jgi:CBS domain-containing protein
MEMRRSMPADHLLVDVPVRRLKPPPAVVVERGTPLGEAIRRMQEDRLRCVLVVEEGRLVGIFTERDVLTRTLIPAADPSAPVDEFMSPDPTTIGAETTVAEAIRAMVEGWHRHLPVVDDRGRPRSLLTARRITGYLVDHFPESVHNLPADPSSAPAAPHGA